MRVISVTKTYFAKVFTKFRSVKATRKYGIHRIKQTIFVIEFCNVQVRNVFEDICRYWRVFNKCPKLKRSSSDVQNGGFFVISPDHGRFYFSNSFRREKRCSSDFKKSDGNFRPEDNKDLKTTDPDQNEPFRSRASTDGTIIARPKRCTPPTICITYPMRTNRRMSISMRGSNSSND